jgi:hypothetical protein
MVLGRAQLNGIKFLLSHLNTDGGLPAVGLNDSSGCWTTAEAIEVLLLSPNLPNENIVQVKEMLEFLLNHQTPGQGWPIHTGNVSTMATGHAVAALALCKRVFSSDSLLVARIDKSLSEGLLWLDTWQNGPGGWGVEPSVADAESQGGRESRKISTCYALRGYLSMGLTHENSRHVRQAINYLVSSVRADGGWGAKEASPSDPANTARVITALLRSGRCDLNHKLIRNGISFILASQASWTFDVESYVARGAPGQVYFHSNTPADVLEALVRGQHFGHEVADLIRFFQLSQEESTGHWHLRDFKDADTSIVTWTTSEAIGVLDLAELEFAEYLLQHGTYRRIKLYKGAFAVAFSVAVLELLYIVGFYRRIAAWWHTLGEGWQQMIVGSIIIGLLIGILANLVSDRARSLVLVSVSRIRAFVSRAFRYRK